ncbi:transposase [Thiocystis violacea]|uniref:transposase n=1 Tax=Thiocystis violacea TaxID=13725 RepID=UPI0019082425
MCSPRRPRRRPRSASASGCAAIRCARPSCWYASPSKDAGTKRPRGSARARSKKSLQAARNAREPWLLVASTCFADWPAPRLVKVYRQRMQIELSFRDMKSQLFGEGLECRASSGAGRYTVLVLIASLAAILLWLIGTAAERCGVHESLRPGRRKRRAYSLLFLARLLLTLEGCRTTIAELVEAIGPPSQWVASDHDALLAE